MPPKEKLPQEVIEVKGQELQNIIDGLSEAVFLIQEDLIVSRLNYSALRLSEKNEYNQVLGRKCHDVFFGSSEICSFCFLRKNQKSFKELFEENSRFKQEVSIHPKHAFSGDRKVFAHKQYFIQTFGNNYFLVELLADITKERAKEELHIRNTKLISLGTVIQIIIHNLKNPLLGMQFTLENLKRKIKIPEAIYSKIKLLRMDIAKASSLINEVTDFVKKKGHPLTPINIKEIIKESYDYISSIQNVALEFHWSWHCADDLKIPGNSLRLKLLFENLFENILYAFKKNRIEHPNIWMQSNTIEKSPRKMKETVQFLCLKIVDNGGGIPKSIIQNVFDPFFTTKKDKKNSGMGLAIANKVVGEHYGTIEVYSVHKYTRFTIHFPTEHRVTQKVL